MNDLISREQAIDAIYKESKYANSEVADEYAGMFVYALKTLPTVKVQKTGKWIGDKCSVCGKGIDDLIESSEWYQNESPRYCPFCGIKIQPSKAESEE